ncbi:MAG: transposase [Lewinella sp.]
MYRSDTIYHLYNHSNGYQPVFRSEENYIFFLQKVRKHLYPVAEIICYCLMPDHFHFMIMPKHEGCQPSASLKPNNGKSDNEEDVFQQEISHQLRVLLSSYTKAYNRRYNLRGSLFRAKTKAKPAYNDFLPEDFLMRDDIPFTQFIPYLKICFQYIHNNPVKAGLANLPTEWEFSSALDYSSLRDGTLCNYALAERLIGIQRL